LVDTVVVALVLPDLVVTVLVDGVALGAAIAGVAIIASAATDQIRFFIDKSPRPRHRSAGRTGHRKAEVTPSFHAD
jgi:hypothetical protein